MQKLELLFTLACIAALAGCGKSGNESKKEAVAAAEAQLADTAKPEEAGPAALVIQVFQENSDAGVAAEVSRLDDTGAAHFVADIDDTGVAKLPQPCATSDRFEAKPRVEAFLRIAPQPCASIVTFRLYSAQAAYALISVAENDEKSGNFAAAQANYGMAAERLQFSKPAEAERLMELASRNAGKLLGVDQPTMFVNGKRTIAPLMVERLKLYQRNANIPVTGVIDQQTREALLRGTTTAIPD
jgi:hypothetical protein